MFSPLQQTNYRLQKKSEPEKFGKWQRSDAHVKVIAALHERLTNQ